MPKHKINAVIWDYDGTLVDTRLKNMNVTRKIIEHVTGSDPMAYTALQSLEKYTVANRKTFNWRELYRIEFNLNEEQVDKAGRLWTAYQLDDGTEVDFYPGIGAIVGDLAQFPQGIVSQNSRQNIIQNLTRNDLQSYFGCIVGYEEVRINKQKPAPDGLLGCMEKLSAMAPGWICYIGDHEADAQCAKAANSLLQAEKIDVNVFCIGACYDACVDTTSWTVQPDVEAHAVEDIGDIVKRLEGY